MVILLQCIGINYRSVVQNGGSMLSKVHKGTSVSQIKLDNEVLSQKTKNTGWVLWLNHQRNLFRCSSSDVRVHPDVSLSVSRLKSHLSKCCLDMPVQ